MRYIIAQRWLSRLLPLAALAFGLGCPAENGTQPGTVTLAINPTSASVQQGGTFPVAVIATSAGGFSGTLGFTISGAPAGLTATVSNIQVSGSTTTATVTLQVAQSTAPGTHTITVRAQGTGIADATATFTLTVTAPPDYALSLAPAALTIQQDGSGTSTVTITRTNFTDAVPLSLSGAPVGVSGVFVPPAPTGTSATLTLTVAASVAPGTYNLTVDGAGTPGNRSSALTLTVTALPPDYSLSVSPPSLTIVQGGSDNATVTITRINFTGTVTLGINTAPGGVSGSFAPGSTTGTTSTLTLNVGAAVAPGTYGVEIAGDGTPGARATILSLTVVARPDYALSLTPAALTIQQDGSGTSTVTITRTNFTGAVTLSVGGAPTGVTGTFVPNATTGTNSTLTIDVGPAVTPGTYNLTVDATAAPRDRSEPLTLIVVPKPNYILSLSPAALTIEQGKSDNTSVQIARINFTGAVTLSLGNAPAGVTGVFAPAAPTGGTSTLTVTVGAAVAPGTYDLTVDGIGTAGNKSTPLSLTVTAAPN